MVHVKMRSIFLSFNIASRHEGVDVGYSVTDS